MFLLSLLSVFLLVANVANATMPCCWAKTEMTETAMDGDMPCHDNKEDKQKSAQHCNGCICAFHLQMDANTVIRLPFIGKVTAKNPAALPVDYVFYPSHSTPPPNFTS